MLTITIPATEMWDENKQEFIYRHAQTLQLEHSLVSLRKWESKWRKPFLHTNDKTEEEVMDYIKCMTLTQNVDPETYNCLNAENIKQINDYISSPMTATTFSKDEQGKVNREIVTAEIIYHWMIAASIPFECQKWHLNTLITLIRVCSIKNSTPKKRSRKDIMSRNAALNAARRRQLNSKG